MSDIATVGGHRKPRGKLAFGLLAGVTIFSLAPWVNGPVAIAQAPELQCTVASMQSAAPADTTIVSAGWLDSPVRNCRVEGYVTTTNPGPNNDNFRLQLPDPAHWKHRFFFIGRGGSGGGVPTDAEVPPGNPLVKGFAVAGTDKGHQTAALDWSFENDPAKSLDNSHRGAHVTTVAAQKIARAFYGTDKMYRYETGCSGGGDMGMKAMQFHPEDYDGVLLGWIGGPHPNPKKDSTVKSFNVMVREMTREPGSWLSPAKRAFLDGAVLDACDMADGAKDQMIWDTRQCHFDFHKLKCRGADGPNCLTGPEITSVTNIIRQTASPISNIRSWTYLGDVPPPWNPSPSRDNASKTSMAYVILNGWARTALHQPDRDIIRDPLTDAELEIIDRSHNKSSSFPFPGGPWDLSGYEEHGGKAIFYVGVGDPAFPHVGMENWFRIWTQKIGANRRDKMARLYQIPGWGHCGGGTGPADGADVMLQALIDWVEKKKAPEGLEMHRGAGRAKLMFADIVSPTIGVDIPQPTGGPRDFLVCRYPKISVFDRSKANVPGAVYDAKNWSCRWPLK